MLNNRAMESDSRSDDNLTRRLLKVCEAVGLFIEYWGFNAIHGRVWTLLALRREPMNQVDVAEMLGVSRSLISGAIAELHEFGLVRPVSDHRNAPWEAVIDVWPAISDILRSREWMLLEGARNALEAAIEEAQLAPGGPDSLEWRVERLRLLLTMTELAQVLCKMLIAIRMPASVEAAGEWIGRAARLVSTLRRS
jgi:DNA-binding transcriptional regulator GbsR (MarR family)